MAPISKPIPTATWARKPSNVSDYRYVSALNSDGNSSNYSSGEENTRMDKKTIPSFMLNDELNGRSYVDPWDMENYSFLRRQLEDMNISDNELSSTPAFESTQSDFYYVPLDNNGSPQYQYKHYVDTSVYKDRVASPIIFKDDSYGLVANIDEHDFYNEYLDTPHPSLSGPESFLEINNPSRQSERSRFNNQDYQTYTPPSIVKDVPELYNPDPRPYRKHYNTGRKPSRRSFSDLQLNHINLEEVYGNPIDYVEEPKNNRRFLDLEARENRRKSLADVKIKLNRRKSFHELSQPEPLPLPEVRTMKIEKRRKSALDRPQERSYDIGIPEKPRTKEKISRRKSMIEIASDLTRIGKNFRTHKFPRKSILQTAENFENVPMKEPPIRDPYEYSNSTTLPRPYLSTVPDSSLVYVYETAKRRRKMVLPNPNTDIYGTTDYRCNGSDIEDAFSMDPIENYMMNRPTSRYMMSNYGHLKIDYSCSWNCLDRYIAHRVRT